MFEHGFRKYEIIKLLNDIKKTIKRVEQNVPIQIDNAINQLLDGAPQALDTLKELADALGNNDNFATYITNQITELNNKITSDYEQISRKVTSLSSQSTDEEYPSAKCVYDIIGDVESALNALL